MVLMGKATQALGQYAYLAMDAKVAVDDAAVLIVDPAIAALGLDTGIAKTLFTYGNVQSLGEILQLLENLIGFHLFTSAMRHAGSRVHGFTGYGLRLSVVEVGIE